MKIHYIVVFNGLIPLTLFYSQQLEYGYGHAESDTFGNGSGDGEGSGDGDSLWKFNEREDYNCYYCGDGTGEGGLSPSIRNRRIKKGG